MKRPKHTWRTAPTELDKPSDERERLWRWLLHEDAILAARMSSFLLAQSILIAIAAGVISALAGLPLSHRAVRAEVFGLSVALILAGVSLTLIFWYILNVNHSGIKVMAKELKALDGLYKRLDELKKKERLNRWRFGGVPNRHGVYWIINNLQTTAIFLVWCLVAAFATAIFVSR